MENRGPMVLLRERCKIFKRDLVADIINKSKLAMMAELHMKDSKGKTYQNVIHEFGSVILHRIPEKPQGGLMMERWVQGVWLGKSFTTDEHIIGVQNGKVVRTRNVRPKSLEDTGSFHEIDKIEGQPWDSSVTLTYEKLRRKNIQGLRSQRQLKKSMSTCPGRT